MYEKDMQQGYIIISKGYTAVSDIAKGNFNLHEIFFGRAHGNKPGD